MIKQTPSQFFCAIMENQRHARLTDEDILRLMESFNQRKYRSPANKIVPKYRNEYNAGKLPGQQGTPPEEIPRYDKYGKEYPTQRGFKPQK